MKHLTPDEIAEQSDTNEEIEQAFIAQDDSHLYPINGAIDATAEAIDIVAAFVHKYDPSVEGLEYAYAIDAAIFSIVSGWDYYTWRTCDHTILGRQD